MTDTPLPPPSVCRIGIGGALSSLLRGRMAPRLLSLFIAAEDLGHVAANAMAARLAVWNIAIIGAGLALAAALHWEIGWVFREGRPGTWLSFAQLLLAAAICRRVWITLKPEGPSVWRHPTSLWRLMWWGFLFLACDEVLKLHETIDHRICDLFSLDRSGPMDHLDDALIGVYGLIAVYILWRYRAEALRLLSGWGWFALAAAGTVGTVIFDFITSSRPLLAQVFSSVETGVAVCDIIEELFKVGAEICFVAAFARVYETVRTPSAQRPPRSPLSS